MKNNQNETSVSAETVTQQAMSAISRYLAKQLADERAEESREFFQGIRGSRELELAIATRSLVMIK